MQGLELTLSFCFEEVVFTLSKEFLLWDIKELLVAETELPFHLGYFATELIVFFLNSSEIFKPIKFTAADRLTLHRESIRFLHQYLTAHSFNGATQGIRLRLFDIIQRKWVMNFVHTWGVHQLCQNDVPLLNICWILWCSWVRQSARTFRL